jgi:hypothetical protein
MKKNEENQNKKFKADYQKMIKKELIIKDNKIL